ncbi:3607_t:CDS:2 [Paraglomus brasilianum]|uniref:3607_t:CDS:1 n=1 Tax=Paraglomus brasilianum TaxID=144538 RepID=A0A9N9A9G1_9GLOM|nr:3607_t:CDS:2 [Paraglomus brasilianum]
MAQAADDFSIFLRGGRDDNNNYDTYDTYDINNNYFDNYDDHGEDCDCSPDVDDWKWEEGMRLINEFGNWTTGNTSLDSYIQETQLMNPDWRHHMKWIPFEQFLDIKFVKKGGFSTVYSATWMNSSNRVWDAKRKTFVEKPLTVALKSLNNSQTLSQDFIDEFKRHGSLKLDGSGYIVHCHGITHNEETQEYMLVMDYAEDGDIRTYVQRNMATLRWNDIIDILCNIAMGLSHIHKNGSFHKNLHCGNILKFSTANIADFSVCGPSNPSEPRGVYGSLPFVAPEVLAGELFSQKADIYSFAFIMWELSSGRPPFADRPHDHSLALEICRGFREAIVPGTPLFYEKLMARCWDANPENRPDVDEILDILLSPYDYQRISLDMGEFTARNINDCDDIGSFENMLASPITNARFPTAPPEVHLFATYTSRLLLYPNLPAPTNRSYDPRPSISSVISSEEIIEAIDETGFENDFEEYDTHQPPPELSDTEYDEDEEDSYIAPPSPPPLLLMSRRKSIAPPPPLIQAQ